MRGRWAGATVACLASGPSLSVEQLASVRDWQGPGHHVIAVNTTFKSAPWADVLFAMDRRWWTHYLAEAKATFHGELWTSAIKIVGVNTAPSAKLGSLGNSGAGAILLARYFGAERVVLLGYDGRRGPKGEVHHHGDHPKRLSNALSLPKWAGQFERMATRLNGMDVVNCSPETAIRVFRTAAMDEVLCSH